MLSDLKYVIRTLLKTPGFTVIAIVILALGIGANTAIFSVVEGALLRPLPFPHSERLVRIFEAQDERGLRAASTNMSDQTVQRFREYGRDIFEDVAAGTGGASIIGLNDGSPPQTRPAARITANFFSVLGLPPALGRTFTAEEEREGGPAVVIVSDDFWRNNLNARPDVLGSTILIDGQAHTVIGVMPRAFRHPYRASLWLPLALPPVSSATATNHYLYGLGRLRLNVSVVQAEAAVRRMCAAINKSDPNPANPRAAYLPPLRESFVIDLRPKLLVIIGAAACAFLIAAANFAGLLLSRVVEREGEFALRAALGASRRLIIRQEVIQAFVLAVVGTALGLILALWATPLLVALSPEGTDATGSAMREFDYAARLDLPVFIFAAGIMTISALGFGFLPAVRASRTDLRSAMNAVSRATTLNHGTRRLLGLFVIVELAIAAALLTASLTATQFFWKLVREPWGFETHGRVVFSTTIPDQFFAGPQAKQNALDATLKQLRVLPGVTSATVTSPSPMHASWNLMPFNPETAPSTEPRGFYFAYSRSAVPGYFTSIGEPLLQGREFADSDGPDAPLVCIVTASVARRFWPNQDPIGKRIKWGRMDDARPWFTVVGVVGDVKSIADPQDGEVIGTMVKPIAQMLTRGTYPLDDITFVASGDCRLITEASIRSALSRVDSHLAAYAVLSLDDAAAQTRTTERFIFVLISAFGLLGLFLAAVGLYGLLSLQVARRLREFGIRSAFGASAAQLIQLVARQGVHLLAAGFTVGGITTWALFRLVQSQYSQMPTPNLLAWTGGAAVLVFAVGIACLLPARRAARVDPIVVLRYE
jgi:putative ABC transport system permease protein